MLIKPNNISRTSTAVFIPLTILALQLTLADKIPVVGYYTLMDYFFLCCFITSMICSIESGLVFALLTSKSRFIYLLCKNRFNLKKLIEKDTEEKEKQKKRFDKHNELTDQALDVLKNIDETDIDDNIDLNNGIRTISAVDPPVKTKVIDEDIDLAVLDDNIIKTDYDDISFKFII